MARPARPESLSDEALLTAFGLGDRESAAVFVRRYQARVFGLAVMITGDRDSAADVAQQAFERAWRHAGSYDARKGSVSGWLLTITRNLAIDLRRVRRADPIEPHLVELLLPPSDLDRPAARAELSDTVAQLRTVLDSLPAEQRRAVLLATVAGRTAAEIGVIEGIPVPTAKTRIRAGLARLQGSSITRGLR
jgi:RNA polymerase sigma factor (sigma-70 family)